MFCFNNANTIYYEYHISLKLKTYRRVATVTSSMVITDNTLLDELIVCLHFNLHLLNVSIHIG